MGALNGIRVVELGHYIAAPFCGQILADHGAEVVKVEPLSGEPSRQAFPKVEGESLYFGALNRGKQSISMDLKDASGQAILKKLILSADVLITNYGPGVPDKLGFGYEAVSSLNPRLVMLQLSGFGQTGRLQDRPAFDGAIQAMSGIMHLTGEEGGPPLKSGAYVADHVVGLQGAIGVLLALHSRQATEHGQLVDVAMLDSMMSLMAYEFARAFHGPSSPARNGNRSANVFATTFETSDGFVYIAPLSNPMWDRLCVLMNRPELAAPDSPYATADGRLECFAYLESAVSAWSKGYTTAEAERLLEQHNIPFGAVLNLESLMAHDQVSAREMILDVDYAGVKVPSPGVVAKLSREDAATELEAPVLGRDSMRVLKRLGYGPDEISDLVNRRVVRVAENVSKLERKV